jgi:hypothetical protein
MLCRVAVVRTDVSEERVASIIRVTRISELGTFAVTSNRVGCPCMVSDASVHSTFLKFSPPPKGEIPRGGALIVILRFLDPSLPDAW